MNNTKFVELLENMFTNRREMFENKHIGCFYEKGNLMADTILKLYSSV